jgi:hypothetical protein
LKQGRSWKPDNDLAAARPADRGTPRTRQLPGEARLLQGCQMVYFHTKNPNFGYTLAGLGMDNVVTFYGQSDNFTAIWYMYFIAIW